MKYPQNEEQAAQVIREFETVSISEDSSCFKIKREIDFNDMTTIIKVILDDSGFLYIDSLHFEIGAYDENICPWDRVMLNLEELNKITEIANFINDRLI